MAQVKELRRKTLMRRSTPKMQRIAAVAEQTALRISANEPRIEVVFTYLKGFMVIHVIEARTTSTSRVTCIKALRAHTLSATAKLLRLGRE